MKTQIVLSVFFFCPLLAVGQTGSPEQLVHLARSMEQAFRSGKVIGSFEKLALIEVDRGGVWLPDEFIARYHPDVTQSLRFDAFGQVSYYLDTKTGKCRGVLPLTEYSGGRSIPRQIVYVIGPNDLRIEKVCLKGSKNMPALGSKVAYNIIENLHKKINSGTSAPGNNDQLARANELVRIAQNNEAALRTEISNGQKKIALVSSERDNYKGQMEKWQTQYIQYSRECQETTDSLRNSISDILPRLNFFLERERLDSIRREEDRRRAEQAALTLDSVRNKFQRAERDFYEPVPPRISRDSFRRVVDEVMDAYIANDSFLTAEDHLIIVGIVGRNKGGIIDRTAPVPGSPEGLNNSNFDANSTVLGNLGMAITKGQENYEILATAESVVKRIPDYLRTDQTAPDPDGILTKDFAHFTGKNYLKAIYDIYKDKPYLEHPKYDIPGSDGMLLKAKILYAQGSILLWNLGDIATNKDLVDPNSSFYKELTDRIKYGKKYLGEVVDMQKKLRPAARILLEQKASRSKIKQAGELTANEKALLYMILDAKDALYKYYQ